MILKTLTVIAIFVGFAFAPMLMDGQEKPVDPKPPVTEIDIKTLNKEHRLRVLENENDCQLHELKVVMLAKSE